MNAWNFLNDEAKAKQAKKLTPAERAALFYFADYQSPAEIADQRIPVKKVPPTDRIERREWGLQRDARNAYCQQLIAACDAGEITHTKTEKPELFIPGGGEWVPPTRNSYLLWDGPSTEWQSRDFNDFQNRVPKVTNYNYSIHKDDFKNYLKSIGDWPVTGLLANWWTDDERQAEEVGGAGTDSQDYKELDGKSDKIQCPKRAVIYEKWYIALRGKHQDNIESIKYEINRLKNDDEIIKCWELAPKDEKYLWASIDHISNSPIPTKAAQGWFERNAYKIRKFKKEPGK
jgi:hypothetical protein